MKSQNLANLEGDNVIKASSSVRPLHTNIVPITDAPGDGVFRMEMSVNPLSVVYLRLRALNSTGTLANFQDYYNLASAFDNVSLTYRGSTIISMSGQDIVALNWLRWGILPEEANPNNVNNARREIIIPLILGSMPYDSSSAFPATRRGDLILSLQVDDVDTGYTGVEYAVDTLEIIGARPTEFERRLTLNRTNTATGNNDLDLVPRSPNRGLLLFGTTGFNGATPVPSFSQVRVLLDNQEVFYAGLDWAVLQSLPSMWGRHRSWLNHKHTLDATVAGITETTSTAQAAAQNFQNYAYLDFDVTRDDAYTLDTTDATRYQLRHVAATADAVRAVQMEVIKSSDLGVS